MLDQALAHHRVGNLPAAEQVYRRILKTDPRNPDALHLLGTILEGRGDPAGAIKLIQQSIALRPGSPEAHYNLGNIFLRQNRFQDAEPCFRRTLALQPRNADAAGNLGGALFRLERYSEAEIFLRQALTLSPNLPTALQNLGALTEVCGRFDETLGYYDRLLKLFPDNADAHYQRAGALLIRGRFKEGWAEYDWRFKRPSAPLLYGRFPFPTWRGEPATGKKILVWTEQGFGEEILTASMIPDLIAAGAHVTLLCSPRLAALFRRSFPEIEIISATDDPGEMDFQASMTDLGRCLRPALEQFPKDRAYLKHDADRAGALRSKYLGTHPQHRLVGFSWRSFSPGVESEKSIPLGAWYGLLRTPGITFVNLQYGKYREEIEAAQRQTGASIVVDPEIDAAGDLDSLAAQAAAMDLIISVSNTTVHLAGALGMPVWALIPANRARLWYWQLEREDSIWYPRVRLFRQTGESGWEPTLARATTALEQISWP